MGDAKKHDRQKEENRLTGDRQVENRGETDVSLGGESLGNLDVPWNATNSEEKRARMKPGARDKQGQFVSRRRAPCPEKMWLASIKKRKAAEGI